MIQLQITRDVIGYLQTRARNERARAEVANIVERWLLSAANARTNGDLPRGSNGDLPRGSNGDLLRRSNRIYMWVHSGSAANAKMAAELVEKKIAHSDTGAAELMKRVMQIVTEGVSACANTHSARVVVAQCRGGLECAVELAGSGEIVFNQPLDGAIEALIKMRSCTAALAVAVRYAVIASGGQQWGLPRNHVRELHRLHGVRNEAFASPLNSRLLGLPDAHFCSLFPDTDGPFGSLGDFFAVDLAATPGNWVVNPPFVEALIERAAARCLDACASADTRGADTRGAPEITFYFVVPAWRDARFYQMLHESPHCAAELALEPGRYYYETPAGARVPTRAPSVYFALSSKKTAAHVRALRQILDA